ncbi:MAG: Ca(2+)-dependent cysteine protease [Cyphobasidiales sp. Tagirdzhanova-0007]|nr:MAG: Ca(2+)-dependent cysteine protease [Cyphobasidiales sp. Tagirdzhanova-0007]
MNQRYGYGGYPQGGGGGYQAQYGQGGPPPPPPGGWNAPPGPPPQWSQGQQYSGNPINYPGPGYNSYGFQQGPDAPYGQPRPYPPSQYGEPAGAPPNHYGGGLADSYPQQGPPQQYQNAPVHFQPQQQGGQPFFYKYSDCSGKRKALLIGVNYTGTSNALRGCHNDARNVARFLQERYNFQQDDMVILMDSPQTGPRQQPTRQNILEAMAWLVSDAQPNDSLFFHYSGHGGQVVDLNGDEDDGYDETIYPIDFKQSGQIIDDDMHAIMIRPLPPGCRLTAIFDSCHSGSALDLPYIYDTTGKIKEPNLLKDAGGAAMVAVTDYMRGDLGGVFSSLTGMGKKFMNQNTGAVERSKQQNTSPADAISWSGCKDTQTSADAVEAGQATGAMSYAFITALTKYPQQSYIQLLNTIRDELKGRFFDDRTLVLVSQGVLGRMLQISPPSTTRRRDTYERQELSKDSEADSNDGAVHPDLSALFLPRPDPSSAVVNLFGTARTDSQDQVEQLYAAQIATILFAKKGAQADVATADKPVCIGLGLKPIFLVTEDLEEQRKRFGKVMQMLADIIE